MTCSNNSSSPATLANQARPSEKILAAPPVFRMRKTGGAAIVLVILSLICPWPHRAEAADLVHEMRRLAESGDPEAQYGLGLALEEGRGMTRDPKEAARWLEMACRGRVAGACLVLGLKYQVGNGVGRDRERAIRCYRMAAERDWPMAQYLLALLYLERGREGDRLRALFWMERAADQGYPGARQQVELISGRLDSRERRAWPALKKQWTAERAGPGAP